MRESGFNTIAWLATASAGFVTTAVLYRLVGVTDFGIWATVVAVKAFVAFLDGGLAFGVARDAARADVEGLGAVRRLAAARVIYVVVGTGAVALALLLAGLPGRLLELDGEALDVSRTVMLLAGLETGMALAFSPLLGIIRGRSRFDVLAAASVAQTITTLGLLVVLAPRAGLPGAAVALVVGRIGAAGIAYAWLRRRGRTLLAMTTGPAEIVSVVRFAGPLWIVAAGTMIGLGTDVPIVGAIHGPGAAGAYAVGATIPAIAVGLLYVLIDTAYPRLTTLLHDDVAALARTLLLVGATLAGLGFSVVALFGRELLAVWLGDTQSLSFAVLVVYSVTWALNVPAHVLALVAIARDRHAILAPLVFVEGVGCIILSIVLALTIGPIGPAVGTLVTLAVSNLLVVPVLLVRRLSIRARPLLRSAVRGGGAGVLAGLAIWTVVTLVALPPLATVIVALGLTLAAAAALLDRGRRAWAIVRHGGWRVLRRERGEQRVVSEMLAGMRRVAPTIWVASQEPLVTVRIATFDRGAIVAERSIASALEQTHRNLEVLVVGDACDPATEAAVRSVRDPRVRFENLPHRGDYPADPLKRWMVAGAAPMNRALELARGTWIAPLDDDDEFTPDHVEVLLDACRTRGLEFAYGIADMEVHAGQWATVGSWPLRQGQLVHASVLYDARLRLMRHAIDAWRVDEPGDWNLWKRMRNAGVRMGFVDRVVCRHYLERREFRVA